MSQEIILLVIGSISCLVLTALAIFAGYILYRRYIKGDYFVNNNVHIMTPCQPIHADNIKTTAITLSQPTNHEPQCKRSHSADSDILHEFVTLAIDSQSSQQTSPKSQATEHSQSTLSESEQTCNTDEEYDSTISPLSTPKSKSKEQSLHHRSDALDDIADDLIREVISHIDDSNSSPLRLSFNSIDHIMDIIEDDEEEKHSLHTEQKDKEISKDTDKVAITRMIHGPHVRIVSDGSRSSISIPSTNFAYSTDATLYAEIMKQNNEPKVEEHKIEEGDIHSNSDGKDDESSDRSSTLTFHNVNDDYQQFHGIETILEKTGATHESPESKENIKKSVNIVRRLDKLNEMDESEMGEDEVDTNNVRLRETPNVKKKISEYKRSIRDMEESSNKKERRRSVKELKMNRVVKTKRLLFEKSDDSSS